MIEYSEKQENFNAFFLLPTSKENYVDQRGKVYIFNDKSIDRSYESTTRQISEQAQLFIKNVELILTNKKIDIICAENFPVGLPPAFSILLSVAAVQYKIPIVLHMHSFTISDVQAELVNQLMWNKISCVSKSIAGDCFQKGADIDLISTDYLGVNTKVFYNTTDKNNSVRQELNILPTEKIIMTATRIIQGRKNILEAKGLITLVQSFSKLSPRHPEMKLLIAVAKAPDRLKNEFDQSLEMLMGYIKLHNVESKTIVKAFSLQEIPNVYRASDVFVLASENETFGQVFTEAMSSGIPVIGTKVGGIPEIINDNRNGYLIQPNDSSVLTQKIEKLVYDEPIKNKFIRAGSDTVNKKFTLKKQLVNFINNLFEIVNGDGIAKKLNKSI